MGWMDGLDGIRVVGGIEHLTVLIREKKREKKREKERTGEKQMSRVNNYQSAFNSQKEKLNMYIGRNAQNLKKLPAGPVVAHYHYYKSSCRS